MASSMGWSLIGLHDIMHAEMYSLAIANMSSKDLLSFLSSAARKFIHFFSSWHNAMRKEGTVLPMVSALDFF
ncbi:MAG TPA: hypothetical protein VLD38_00010 [Nitrosopumilaceae archaeon]|nr:hypothetical protein [Nitrosopumilaceae archaeon]